MGVRIINADVLDGLRQLPDESVHCVVTSPPYWGLRDYGTGTWDGGDPDCEHRVCERPSISTSTLGGGKKNVGHQLEGFKSECPRCGAKRIDRQIGLEETPDAYVARMVEVFREVRRVLRNDGVAWFNLGDSYCNGDKWGGGGANTGKHTKSPDGSVPSWLARRRKWAKLPDIKPKDLVGIPWMVAFALRSDGWWLRGDYIWAKPNPMPESVTDRCTKSHEYIFHLTKSERYYWDAEAIKEVALWPDGANSPQSIKSPYGQGFARANVRKADSTNGSAVPGAPPHTGLHRAGSSRETTSRNKRSVWTVATSPFPEAHFATFPPDLIEPMILAGTSQHGCCAECGAPWERETERGELTGQRVNPGKGGHLTPQGYIRNGKSQCGVSESATLSWVPTCDCDADVDRCTVLDPFSGAGTTALVADRLQRNAIGIELNPEYVAMSERRIHGDRGALLDLMEAV